MRNMTCILTVCFALFTIIPEALTINGAPNFTTTSSLFAGRNEHAPLIKSPADSTWFARVIIYRPDNQLSRNYQVKTNQHAPFTLKKKEKMTLEAHTNVLEVEVSASAHRSERFTFMLSKDKVHYFRVQDRNNYSGMRPFLEIIEVNEATFVKDGLRIQ